MTYRHTVVIDLVGLTTALICVCVCVRVCVCVCGVVRDGCVRCGGWHSSTNNVVESSERVVVAASSVPADCLGCARLRRSLLLPHHRTGSRRSRTDCLLCRILTVNTVSYISLLRAVMLILVLVLVVKDSLRTNFKSLSLSWSL